MTVPDASAGVGTGSPPGPPQDAAGPAPRSVPVLPRGTLRYWAAAKAAAGAAEEPFTAATLAGALDGARAAHGDRLAAVLDRCSFLVDGAPVGRRAHATIPLRDGAVVEVLPPFAGG